MTSQDHPYARFRRALDSGNATIALSAASELPKLSLADALALCLVLRSDEDRYSRACARWLSRYGLEVAGVTLDELQIVAACLRGLVGCRREASRAALERVFAERSQRGLAEALRRLR